MEYPFLKLVDSCSLRCAIFDLDKAFTRYYKVLSDYPKFKVKGNKETYRTNLITSKYKEKVYENIKIDLKNKEITLSKLKTVKIRGYRNLKKIEGRIINATIKKVAGKYYVSIVVEENIIMPLRKVRGSNNYQKTKIKLQEVYRKLKNARTKTTQEIVSKITKSNDIIIAEKLKVKEMIEKRTGGTKSLRKNIINATFGEILRKLEYKCLWLNKVFYQVNTYYPSSQICNRCGNKDKNIKDLSKREYKCPKCGIEVDRDINASINIMFEGICKYYKERYN